MMVAVLVIPHHMVLKRCQRRECEVGHRYKRVGLERVEVFTLCVATAGTCEASQTR